MGWLVYGAFMDGRLIRDTGERQERPSVYPERDTEILVVGLYQRLSGILIRAQSLAERPLTHYQRPPLRTTGEILLVIDIVATTTGSSSALAGA